MALIGNHALFNGLQLGDIMSVATALEHRLIEPGPFFSFESGHSIFLA